MHQRQPTHQLSPASPVPPPLPASSGSESGRLTSSASGPRTSSASSSPPSFITMRSSGSMVASLCLCARGTRSAATPRRRPVNRGEIGMRNEAIDFAGARPWLDLVRTPSRARCTSVNLGAMAAPPGSWPGSEVVRSELRNAVAILQERGLRRASTWCVAVAAVERELDASVGCARGPGTIEAVLISHRVLAMCRGGVRAGHLKCSWD